jgi:hypothetical protein
MVYEAKNKFPAMRGRGSKIMDLYGKNKKRSKIYHVVTFQPIKLTVKQLEICTFDFKTS